MGLGSHLTGPWQHCHSSAVHCPSYCLARGRPGTGRLYRCVCGARSNSSWGNSCDLCHSQPCIGPHAWICYIPRQFWNWGCSPRNCDSELGASFVPLAGCVPGVVAGSPIRRGGLFIQRSGCAGGAQLGHYRPGWRGQRNHGDCSVQLWWLPCRGHKADLLAASGVPTPIRWQQQAAHEPWWRCERNQLALHVRELDSHPPSLSRGALRRA